MHGDRQGWMLERSDAAVRPTEADLIQPCIAQTTSVGRSPRALPQENLTAKNANDSRSLGKAGLGRRLRSQRLQIGNDRFGVAAVHAKLRHRRTKLSAGGPDAGRQQLDHVSIASG